MASTRNDLITSATELELQQNINIQQRLSTVSFEESLKTPESVVDLTSVSFGLKTSPVRKREKLKRKDRSLSGRLTNVSLLFKSGRVNTNEKEVLKNLLMTGDKHVESLLDAYYEDSGNEDEKSSALRRILSGAAKQLRPRGISLDMENLPPAMLDQLCTSFKVALPEPTPRVIVKKSPPTRPSLSLSMTLTIPEEEEQWYAEKVPLVFVNASFHDTYLQGDLLGHGTTSLVYACTKKAQATIPAEQAPTYAVKVIEKNSITNRKFMDREVHLLSSLTHPHLVSLLQVHESSDEVFLVLERCEQELFAYLEDNGPLSEKQVQLVMRQLLSVTAYLHSKGIVHRDIKPENLLLVTRNDLSVLKLTDFGAARLLPTTGVAVEEITSTNPFQLTRALTQIGTKDYAAPEIKQGHTYSNLVDAWSIGIVGHVLLTGMAPHFAPAEDGELQISFTDPQLPPISLLAQDFLQQFLHYDPSVRTTCTLALEHEFMTRE